jgi:DNA-binding NarL/FixJ family response regulator
MLLVACSAEYAQRMMIYSTQMEITYLPGEDMDEIREEIERLGPKLILCGADAFLDVLYERSPVVSNPSNQDRRTGTLMTAEANDLSLGRRERKILAMLAKGQTNDEIAKSLRLSSRTVKRSLSNLFERLGVTNRTELAGRVAELSLLKDDD